MSHERIIVFVRCQRETGESQSEIDPNMSLYTCCICFFSISVGRKKSQSSVYVNQCSVGGRVMTLVCKNNTSSTRERAFAFASFSPFSLSILRTTHHVRRSIRQERSTTITAVALPRLK